MSGHAHDGSAPVSVVRLQPVHWALLRQVRLQALAHDPDAFGGTYDDEARKSPDFWVDRIRASAWFVAYSGEVPVGMVAGVVPPNHHAGERQLDAMWVAPEWRGSGVADHLAAAVINWARSLQATALSLTVAESNASAYRMYTRLGFSGTGERTPRRRDPSQSSQRMRLLLQRGKP